MDLSALIFIAVALGWAGYLIPKAMKRTDEMNESHSVEEFSDDMRRLDRRPAETGTSISTSAHPLTRQAAREAAKRRRIVLGALLAVTAVVAGCAGFALISWWWTAIPVVLIVVFLTIARFTVRNQMASRPGRVAVPSASFDVTADSADEAENVPLVNRKPQARAGAAPDPSADHEETEAFDQARISQAVHAENQLVADEGALWDPLPITVPTYVEKAHARRTVRTIDLTGMNSSGHDEADSKLAREADAERAESRVDEGDDAAEATGS